MKPPELRCLCTALLAAYAALPGTGAAQERRPPVVYWISVATENMSLPGTGIEGGLAAGMMGQGMPSAGPRRSLLLQLGSPNAPTGAPHAEHEIPPGQNMGKSLPLLTPEREPARSGRSEVELDIGDQKPPRVRMLIYWGCGEQVRPGQPVIVDTASMTPIQFGKALAGRRVSPPQPPAPGRARTYGDWPNARDQQPIPRDGSLQGAHAVQGNYTPDIPFQLDSRRDFMAPLQIAVRGSGTDAQPFTWQSVPTSIGYFAAASASVEKTGEMILWSSSEAQEPGWSLFDYLPNTEVQRLIRDQVVMPADITRCVVPRGIFKDAGGAMLRMIAYGDELNLTHPPRPADPKQPWNPIWTVKVRLKSTGMAMLDAGDMDIAEGRAPARREPGARPPQESAPPGEPRPADPAGQVLEGVKQLKGLFGF